MSSVSSLWGPGHSCAEPLLEQQSAQQHQAWRPAGLALLFPSSAWEAGVETNGPVRRQLAVVECSRQASSGKGRETHKSHSHSHRNLSLRQTKNRFHMASSTNNFSGKQLCIYATFDAFYTVEGGYEQDAQEVIAPMLPQMRHFSCSELKILYIEDADFHRPGDNGSTLYT